MSISEIGTHPYREMGEIILRELDHFDRIPEKQPRFANPADYRPDVVEALTKIQREVLRNDFATRVEPFIACLKVRRNGREEFLLISRNYAPEHDPFSKECTFASYLSPLGSIAAKPLGAPFTVQVPAGRLLVEILERSGFTSVRRKSWDAVENEYAAGARIRLNIPSVRELLSQAVEAGSAAAELDSSAPAPSAAPASAGEVEVLEVDWEAFAGEVLSGENVHTAVRRVIPSVAAKVELRDRPLLDELQDPIFRLPVHSRLVLTGAAGTGKSTVLIKRLSQKTKAPFLLDEELRGLTDEQLDHLLDPGRSWVLFTPNDLLRNYLKEALGREQLPATEQTVRTWADTRMRLARDTLGILSIGDKGVFKRTSSPVLVLNDLRRRKLLQGFRAHCDDRYRGVLKGAVKALDAAEAVCREIEKSSWSEGPQGPRSSLPEQFLNFNRQYVDHCAAALGLLGDPKADPYDTVIGLQSIRQEHLEVAKRAQELGAMFARVVLQRVEGLRARVGGSNVLEAPERLRKLLLMSSAERKKALTLDERRALTEIEKGPYGQIAVLLRAWEDGLQPLRPLMRGLQAFLSRLPNLFHDFRLQFRKSGPAASKWMTEDGAKAIGDRRISDEEIDLLVYAMLDVASDLFARRPELLWNASGSALLEAIKSQMRTVVAVDEAPDFSWVQLGCMYHLSHPAFRSFCMSGDLMQRVTETGLRRWEDVHAFAPDTMVHTLDRVYRQSASLLAVAGILYEVAMKEPPPFASPFPAEHEPPPLRYRSADRTQTVNWVAERIIEIYQCVGYLPTIAVFVPDEAEVAGTAELLREVLDEHAITVEACEKGQVLGVGEHVRVFAVEHIKGLEFHAVFLIDLDRLSRKDGDLAMRYLYLALTRAVMFLGVTTSGRFPARLAPVAEAMMEGDWKEFARPVEAAP